jgi:cytochrome c oxidase subunit 1
MFKFKDRPYTVLLLTAVLFFIAGLFSFNYPIDIHLHDTYFVIPMTYLVWIPTITLVFFWLIYLLTKRLLFSKFLTWTHIVFTILCTIFIVTIPFLSTYSYAGGGAPRRYYDYGSFTSYKIFGNMTRIIIIAFIILIFGQLTYFINLIVGLYKKVITGPNSR